MSLSLLSLVEWCMPTSSLMPDRAPRTFGEDEEAQ